MLELTRMLGLTNRELSVLKKLKTPIQIQDFLDTLKINFEIKGETIQSPRRVLKTKTAHCIEGALLAATAFWVNGEDPLIVDLRADPTEDDHVVALYKYKGFWGAISKSNHATLRFRDPVYKTLRELALSYFHEYFKSLTGKKVLRSYSRPFNLKRLGEKWVTAEENLWYISDLLDESRHYELFPKSIAKVLREADPMERKVDKLHEWQKPKR